MGHVTHMDASRHIHKNEYVYILCACVFVCVCLVCVLYMCVCVCVYVCVLCPSRQNSEARVGWEEQKRDMTH